MSDRPLRCSFCARSEDEVAKLVAGGAVRGVFICDACVADAARIMAGSSPAAEARSFWGRLRVRLRQWRRAPAASGRRYLLRTRPCRAAP